jgi:hypothetical protein
VVDEVGALVQQDRKAKQGDITTAVNQVLQLSPANTFLETFSITPRQEKHKDHRTLVDLDEQESSSLKARLEADFAAMYGSQMYDGESIQSAMLRQPRLAQTYRRDVLSPVA